ncbi:MAG: pilus assembly protein TadG-related protein [bacterium]|nr:pilus assembly protein TadG-related protein [bacterium]
MARFKALRPFLKRERLQSGQSIIVLALGMIALLGFVGIVTDVSLLFVRYSSLSRAVDAAAVAAAGQLRRIPDDDRGALPDLNGEAASVAQLGLAARQFIEVYGIDPTTVLVETCRVQRYVDVSGTPVDRNGTALFIGSVENAAANQEDLERYQALCTEDELKLVRVTAQIDAPTTFMSLLGYQTVTLTVEAISQTAVLDVVLVFDVSERMLTETTYDDWETVGMGTRYLPPRENVVRTTSTYTECWDWETITAFSQEDLVTNGLNVIVGGLPVNCPASLYQAFEWVPTGVTGQTEPPLETCRVRLWPASDYSRAFIARDWLAQEYIRDASDTAAPFADEAALRAYFDDTTTSLINLTFRGFVPQYSYFGCCNDPNADWDFSDLVCQPFGEAREAAQGFLDRLDFLRGDRIGFVSYDRSAYVIDPDGTSGAQIPMIETQNNITSGATIVRRGAEEVLNTVMGVRAEPTFYQFDDAAGRWECLITGETDIVTGAPECITNLDAYHDRTIYQIVNHPTETACPLDPVAMDGRFTGPYGEYRYDQPTNSFVPRGATSYFDQDTPLDDIKSLPAYVSSLPWTSPPYRDYSYEFIASCAGGNIGGALGTASSMLYLNGRREGAVWLMVLLSSGAAGSSDPVGRLDGASQATTALEPNVFNLGPSRTLGGTTAQVYEPEPGEYGAFGLCPYGTQANPGELLRNLFPPYCLDRFPETRTFCANPTQADAPNLVPVDNPINPDCEEFYDVDDYARDWADYIALEDLNLGTSAVAAGRSGDQLLPNIFTIGFGINYDAVVNEDGTVTYQCGATDYACQRGFTPNPEGFRGQERIGDYVGEELLRYIADAGDNFRIDSDYWQFFMGQRIGNGVTDLATAEWGTRGACEIEVADLGSTGREEYAPLPPRTSCGNYYVAATADDLNLVFNEIASRMFTRLSQ